MGATLGGRAAEVLALGQGSSGAANDLARATELATKMVREFGLSKALGPSRLRFLSGSFDGTTVRVYLAGTLDPAGACDLPRVEAQLTQTALEASGAVRANIYLNGELLDDYLDHARAEPTGNR